MTDNIIHVDVILDYGKCLIDYYGKITKLLLTDKTIKTCVEWTIKTSVE